MTKEELTVILTKARDVLLKVEKDIKLIETDDTLTSREKDLELSYLLSTQSDLIRMINKKEMK